MRDRLLIFCGLFVFIAVATFPMWRSVAAKTSTREPELQLPKNQTTCVAPVSYMRAAHMKFLIGWREGAVREHQSRYTAYDGRSYKVSLTNTCLGQCHGSKKEFCDRCHNYMAVSAPYCWDCHQDSPYGGNHGLCHSSREEAMKITRKDFLRVAGGTVLAAGAGQLVKAIGVAEPARVALAQTTRRPVRPRLSNGAWQSISESARKGATTAFAPAARHTTSRRFLIPPTK